MSTSQWTTEQWQAITERDCNLLVAAAAGAGKTAVLVERIICRITDEKTPVDIDRLLVVTFTNAAATEMRERIGDAIGKALDGNPSSRRLQQQLTLLNKANITTIHSFCLEVIRNNFHCIELDPAFRIADVTEGLLMKLEALEELFEEQYEAGDSTVAFLELVECYGGSRDDKKLQDLVLNIYEFVQSHPWPEQWMEEHVEAFLLLQDVDFIDTAWGQVILEYVRLEIQGLLSLLNKAMEIINGCSGLEPYQECFGREASQLEALFKNIINEKTVSWDKLCTAFSEFEFQTLPRAKDADKARQEEVREMRDEVKTRVKKLREEIFYVDSATLADQLREIHPLMKTLVLLVKELEKKYSGRKKTKGLLDFNDLEHFCLEILSDEKIARQYRERFEEVMVDEYQDSNLVQEVILSRVSRKDDEKPNLFMVGDVKQSIYRFRQARPELFMEKYNTYSEVSGGRCRRIQLFKNFRSRGEVIHAANFIFRQIMSVNVGELNYDEKEALHLGAAYGQLPDEGACCGGSVELHLLETEGREDLELPEEGQDGDESSRVHLEEEPLDVIQCEARLAGKIILEMMYPPLSVKPYQVYDKALKAYRPLELRDIVILLRTTSGWADVFAEEFGRMGIPAFADSGKGFFKTIEVQVMLSLLQIIDNPLQDIPLLSVLRSPIGGFSAEELVDIRLSNRETDIYHAMKCIAQDASLEVGKKSAEFLSRLESWRDRAVYLPTDELLWNLYTDTGYYSFAGAMPAGIQRQANLRILFERARQFEKTSYKGLFNFIHFINRLKSSKGDMGSAKILGEKENVVRIMSIHKSKGLEFPFVILGGCGKRFNLQDMNRNILLHQDLGFGPDFVDYHKRVSWPTVPKQALKQKILLETLSEEMRILYVALTRAREKLIITGRVKNLEKIAGKWCDCLGWEAEKLPGYGMLKAKNYLDWIGPALVRHPDAQALRQAGAPNTQNIFLREDISQWKVRLWNRSEVEDQSPLNNEDKQDGFHWLEEESPAEDLKISDEIYRRLEWRYPYDEVSKLPAKISVTEMKRRFQSALSEDLAPKEIGILPLVKKPAFMEETVGLSAAEKGTILHFIMQHLDLKKVSTLQELDSQLTGMVSKELLGEEQAKTVNLNTMLRFFDSDLGQRMLAADRVMRELPFYMELDSQQLLNQTRFVENENSQVQDTAGYEEKVLLQGVIDCCFEEKGSLVLLDYKTDYVAENGLNIIREKYRAQLGYYAEALEKITGKKVAEKYIYLFRNGEVLSYE